MDFARLMLRCFWVSKFEVVYMFLGFCVSMLRCFWFSGCLAIFFNGLMIQLQLFLFVGFLSDAVWIVFS